MKRRAFKRPTRPLRLEHNPSFNSTEAQRSFSILPWLSYWPVAGLLPGMENFRVLRRRRLRERDFLDTKQCARVNQCHFGGKTRSPSPSYYHSFQRKCRSDGIKISNARSFIILRSGEGLTTFNTFLVKKKRENEAFWGVCFFENIL